MHKCICKNCGLFLYNGLFTVIFYRLTFLYVAQEPWAVNFAVERVQALGNANAPMFLHRKKSCLVSV